MKTITLPVLIPDWAKWIAQDADGMLFIYEEEPKENQSNEQWDFGCRFKFISNLPPNPNWRKTLRKVE